MTIEYRCSNCGNRFKPRDYIKLDPIYISDGTVLQGRKCGFCGTDIKIENKIVKA